MSRIRKTFVGALILMLVIQTIQPMRNISEGLSENDISKTFAISDHVHGIFKEKCYDCHSNNTRYPWYNYIQPIGWWLSAHIYEGKEHFDFSSFKTYSTERAAHKLGDLSEVIKDGTMPLEAYTWLHRDAIITPAERDSINAWLTTLPVEIKSDYH